MGKFAYLLVVPFLFSACTLAPKYLRPNPPVPDKWPGGAAYRSSKESLKIPGAREIRWQEFFTDKRLKEIIKTALHNNRNLKLAALNVEETRAMYGVKRADLFPVVNATAARSKQRMPDTHGFGQKLILTEYSAGLGITSWEIDFFGRIRSLERQALEEYFATEEARRGVQISLVSEVARVYFTLAADREDLRLARSTLETQKALYDLIKKRYDVGLATELDLNRVKTQVQAAKRDVAYYVRLTARDKNALALLTGYKMPHLPLPHDLNSAGGIRKISSGIPSEVLLNRPDIMAAEHRLKGAYAFIGAARAAFFPRISLTTAIGTASHDLSGLFGAGSKAWRFVSDVTLPVFDARTWAAYRVSKAERKIALAKYEQTIQRAFREVADSLAVQGTVDRQVSAQRAFVDAAYQTYHLSMKRYATGTDSYLSVLDAQRSLYVAQQQLVSLRLLKIANKIRLYAALGGGGD